MIEGYQMTTHIKIHISYVTISHSQLIASSPCSLIMHYSLHLTFHPSPFTHPIPPPTSHFPIPTSLITEYCLLTTDYCLLFTDLQLTLSNGRVRITIVVRSGGEIPWQSEPPVLSAGLMDPRDTATSTPKMERKFLCTTLPSPTTMRRFSWKGNK
jgi:hypothetical protein